MATITSAQAGNWSNTSTWVGGVVPTSVDDVVLSHNVAADVDISIRSLIHTGDFTLSVTSSRMITVSSNIGSGSSAFGTSEITISASSPSVIQMNVGEIRGKNSGNPVVRSTINITNNSTVYVNGSVFSGLGTGGTYALYILGAATVYVNGIVLGNNNVSSPLGLAAAILIANASSNVYVNGTGTAGLSNSIVVTAGNLFLGGVFQSSATRPYVYALAGGFVFLRSCVITSTDTCTGIIALTWGTTIGYDAQINLRSNVAATLRPIYTAGLLTGYPLESKVEDGTVYGPSSEFEGTLLPWDATFAQALATAQRDLQLPSILSAITAP